MDSFADVRRILITGAPGTGKTHLIAELGRSYPTVAEPARRVLAEHGGAYAQIEGFHEHVVAAYDELGYELVELPRVSIQERTDFVLENVTES